jgi:uncharacterized protein
MEDETVVFGNFEWDRHKAKVNIAKHGVDFFDASMAFLDGRRIIAVDDAHSDDEPRFFCIGKYNGQIITVRFTYRWKRIRLIGAGMWRKGKRLYEKENKIE